MESARTTIVAPWRARSEHAVAATRSFASGVGAGFGSEAASAAHDLRVIASFFRENGAAHGARTLGLGLRTMGSSRTAVSDALSGAFIAPIRDDLRAGRSAQAMGRAGFHLATLVLPGDKVIRAAAAVIARSAETANEP